MGRTRFRTILGKITAPNHSDSSYSSESKLNSVSGSTNLKHNLIFLWETEFLIKIEIDYLFVNLYMALWTIQSYSSINYWNNVDELYVQQSILRMVVFLCSLSLVDIAKTLSLRWINDKVNSVMKQNNLVHRKSECLFSHQKCWFKI